MLHLCGSKHTMHLCISSKPIQASLFAYFYPSKLFLPTVCENKIHVSNSYMSNEVTKLFGLLAQINTYCSGCCKKSMFQLLHRRQWWGVVFVTYWMHCWKRNWKIQMMVISVLRVYLVLLDCFLPINFLLDTALSTSPSTSTTQVEMEHNSDICQCLRTYKSNV